MTEGFLCSHSALQERLDVQTWESSGKVTKQPEPSICNTLILLPLIIKGAGKSCFLLPPHFFLFAEKAS